MANKKKRCKLCKEYVEVEKGLQIPAGFFCSINAAAKWAAIKEKERKEKRNKKERQCELKTYKNNDIPKQLELTQKSFNRMRRLEELLWFKERNVEPYCISCLKPLGNDVWSCGHYRSVGASSALRFDKLNTYLQHNVRCNMHLSGNIYGAMNTVGYEGGLIYRFGEDRAIEIMEYCKTTNHIVKYKSEQLILMRKEFNSKSREISALLQT